jgi:hypothetical protein
MTRAEFDHLLATVQRMAETADILSRAMALFARSEKNPQRHATFSRLHSALNDCGLSLRHTLDAAPTMVQA